MSIPDLPPGVSKALPGVFGSAIAVFLIQDASVPRRVGMFVSGAALSYFATPDLARMVNLTEGFTGFLSGLLGMAVAKGIFDAISKFGWGQLLNDWLRKVAGLPPKEN